MKRLFIFAIALYASGQSIRSPQLGLQAERKKPRNEANEPLGELAMNEQECLTKLIDSSSPVEDKVEMLAEYFRVSEAVAPNNGGQDVGREVARGLTKRAAEQGGDNPATLEAALQAVFDHCKQTQANHAKQVALRLRSLTVGTPVTIREGNCKRVVFFLEMKRTRFIVEFPDGRRFSVPVDAFAGVVEGETVRRLSDDVRKQRELVRALVGRSPSTAEAAILREGPEVVSALLDELAATNARIAGEPVGVSDGAPSSVSGPVGQVNVSDLALAHRIVAVIREIAAVVGGDLVRERVEQHPNEAIREQILNELEWAKVMDELKSDRMRRESNDAIE